MKRTLVTIFGVLLVAGGVAYALEEQWSTDKNANSHHIRNLPAPAGPTEPAREQDVAPGACIPKATGANTLPFVCSVPNTDFVTPSFTLGGDLSGTPPAANVIKLLEAGGPTHLTVGTIADGALTKRSGSTFIGATAGTDFENALSFTAPLSRATNTISISANGIGNALIRQGAATSLIGNPTNGTANEQDIPCSSDGDVFWRSSTTLGCSALAYSKLTGAPSTLPPSGNAGGDLGGTYPNPTVLAIHETSGPTKLTIGAVPDTGYLQRSGTALVGSTTIPYSVLTGTPTALPPSGSASGDLGGTYPAPTVVASEWSGTRLTFGALADGALPKRSGTTLIAATPGTDYTVSVAGTNGVTATNVAGAVTVDGGQLVASWPVANVRWYCVDGGAGNDGNVGYSESSSADCGTKAKATFAGLAAIFPRACNGHKPVVVVKAGTYTGGLDVFLNSISGCAANFPLVVATGTNSTAGATAFAGDANDRLNAGGVTATGMFAAGYNPIGTLSASLVQAQKVGGGSPGFAAEPAIPLLVRMRFDAATTTAALRNVSRMVMIVTGADTLTPLSAFPATPAGTDVFYLEQPGVITGAGTLSIPPQSTQTVAQIVGFRTSSGTTAVVGGTFILSFCDFTGLNSAIGSDLVLRPTYVDEAGTTRTMGAGVRINGAMGVRGNRNANLVQEAFGTTGTQSLVGGNLVSWGNGTSTWTGLQISNYNATVGNEIDQPLSMIGARAHVFEPVARIRGTASSHSVNAGLYCQQSNFSVAALDIAGMGSNPAIYFRGTCNISVSDQLTGSSGNTDVGLDLTGSINSIITVYTLPTVTGTAGDIRLFDGTIATWAQAQAGLVDTNGNRFIGYGLPFPIRRMPAGTTLSGGSLTVPSLVGPGFVKASGLGLFSVDSTTYLGDPGGNGLVSRTASGTTSARTITAGDATIVVTNGSGVSGNPTITGGYVAGSGVTITGNSISATGAGGTVTNVTATLPLVSTHGTTPDISLQFDNASITLSGGNALQRAALTGAITATAGSNATAFGNLAGLSVLGRSAGSTGIPAAITSTTSGDVFWNNAGALSWSLIPESSVTGLVSDLAAKELALTFSTGLTRSTNTITANLSTGVGGGQSVIGGTAASNSLTISSTSNGTKGTVIFGTTAKMLFDESATTLTIGGAVADASLSVNSGAAVAAIHFANGTADSGGYLISTSGSEGILAGGSTFNGSSWVAKNATASILDMVSGGAIIFADAGLTPGVNYTPTARFSVASGGGVTLSSLGTGIVKSTAGLLVNATAGTDYVHSVSAGAGMSNFGTAADPIIGMLDFGSPGTYGGSGSYIEEVVTDVKGRVSFVQPRALPVTALVLPYTVSLANTTMCGSPPCWFYTNSANLNFNGPREYGHGVPSGAMPTTVTLSVVPVDASGLVDAGGTCTVVFTATHNTGTTAQVSVTAASTVGTAIQNTQTMTIAATDTFGMALAFNNCGLSGPGSVIIANATIRVY